MIETEGMIVDPNRKLRVLSLFDRFEGDLTGDANHMYDQINVTAAVS